MTINIPGDRSIAPSSTPETAPASRLGTHGALARATGFGDNISVSSSTANIQSTLDDLSVARTAKVAKLAQLYSSGRYAPDSTAAARSLISTTTSSPDVNPEV